MPATAEPLAETAESESSGGSAELAVGESGGAGWAPGECVCEIAGCLPANSAMADEDQYGISQSGLVARSPEGHAARGMQIKGNEDVWIEIQAHTFKNWVNEKLAPSGLMVEDLVSDLRDGVCLVTLVEILQQKKLRKISRPMNQHQWLENVTTALRAIEQDGIKLVNIGESPVCDECCRNSDTLVYSFME